MLVRKGWGKQSAFLQLENSGTQVSQKKMECVLHSGRWGMCCVIGLIKTSHVGSKANALT